MHGCMQRPTVIVHLDVESSVALDRIRKRGRPCEAGITIEYLTALHDAYEIFLAQLGKEVPVLRFSWAEFVDAEAMAHNSERDRGVVIC